MNLQSLKIGDLIVREKGPVSAHYIVYVGIHNGIQMVAENQVGVGVRFTSLKNALAGNEIRRFEKFGGTEAQRSLVIPKIKRMLGRTYDLIVFNCEHFGRLISHGKIESKQVKVAGNVAIGTGALLLFSKNSGVQRFGFFVLLLGVLIRIVQKINEN